MTGLTFRERMEGRVAFGQADFNEGWRTGDGLAFELQVDIADLDAFLTDDGHEARIEGVVDCGALGGALPVTDGTFNLFVDGAADRRRKRMRYRLRCSDRDGRPVTFSGFKEVVDGPGLDIWTDTTTLFVTVHAGPDEQAPVTGAGVLRLSHAGLVAMILSLRARGGAPWARAAARLRFGRHFLGELWQAYGAASRLGDAGDRPDMDPLRGHPPGTWHDVPGQAGLQRRILPLTSGDLRPLTLHHVRGARAGTGPPAPPVLCLHGVGVRGDIFLGAPGGASVARSLVDAGRDVWILNWRASMDFPPNDFTLDDAAVLDHPRAIAEIRRLTGHEQVDVLAHCQGATSFTIAALSGLVPEVRNVLTSAVSLHAVAPFGTKVKSTVLLPVAALRLPYLNAQWGLRAPTAIARTLVGVAMLARRRECDNRACRMGNYMYGVGRDVLYVHDDLDAGTHDWMARELGFAPVGFLRQMARCLRRGHLVTTGEHDVLARDLLDAPLPAGQRWTFLAGTRNRLYLPEGQRRSHAHFDARDPGRHRLALLDGLGHLDPLVGEQGRRVAHPEIVAALA